MASQIGNEGLCLPMPERSFRPKTLTLGAAATQARHLGVGAGLVQEDQSVRLKAHLRLPLGHPFVTGLSDVGTILFAGLQGFF